MVAGTLLPWVSGIADLTGYYGQNLFHLSASGEFTIDGVFGVGLGGVALLFGMARVAPTILPARLARSPAWTTLGCALLLGVDIPRADQVVRAANQTPHVGGAWLGLGIWVFGSGMAVAFASALLLLLANSPSPK